MSSALLRWISSKGWPSDGSMTAMLRPETDATQALAIWFSCMGRYFARNPIAVLCWQKNCPLAHFLAALTAIFFAVFEAQAPGSRALEHPGLPWRCACPATHAPGAARAKPLAPPPSPPRGCAAAGGPGGGGSPHPPTNLTTNGTVSSATMLMILISGLIAGPAVSL